MLALLPAILVALQAGAPAQQKEWKLSAAPVVRIGELDGGPAYLFANLGSLLRLPDGRIVVADGQSNQIRVFSADGKHIATHGRQGNGPGEYQWLQGLWRARGDTLIALDQRMGKVTVLSPSFVPVRTMNWGWQVRLSGVTANGSYFMIGSAPRGGAIKSGVITEYDGLILRIKPENGALDTLARAEGSRFLFREETVNGRAVMMQYPIPFNPMPHHAIGANMIVYGAGTKPEIERFDTNGRRLSPLQLTSVRRRVTPADVQRFEQWLVEQYRPEQRPAARQRLTQVKAAEQMPTHGQLAMDNEGDVWVQRYAPPWEPALRWDVYNAAGRNIATVRLPARFTIREIGSDYVLGFSKDEFDVERVEMYRLTK
jgi:hypothetical protein